MLKLKLPRLKNISMIDFMMSHLLPLGFMGSFEKDDKDSEEEKKEGDNDKVKQLKFINSTEWVNKLLIPFMRTLICQSSFMSRSPVVKKIGNTYEIVDPNGQKTLVSNDIIRIKTLSILAETLSNISKKKGNLKILKY